MLASTFRHRSKNSFSEKFKRVDSVEVKDRADRKKLSHDWLEKSHGKKSLDNPSSFKVSIIKIMAWALISTQMYEFKVMKFISSLYALSQHIQNRQYLKLKFANHILYMRSRGFSFLSRKLDVIYIINFK